ncbi:MAG: M42 family metallopeptidase [Clostridia bacterium]|nr:M42 family metallopeptidase [Clostridia bacterium]
MNSITSTLRALTNILSVSGAEEKMAAYISETMRPLCDDVNVDAMGNVICKKNYKGAKETVMLTAHMDEIGFLVCDIDENGFVLLAPIGGIHADAAAYTRVKFENGRLGVLVPSHGTKAADLDARAFACDIGAKNRAAAEKLVKIGDRCASFVPLATLAGKRVTARALDNKAGVLSLICAADALKDEKDMPYNLVYVFTVQEEVGLRGAAPAAFAVEPDYCINVDVTSANDAYGAKGSVKLGGGACIKFKDRSVICNRRMICHLQECAKKAGLKTQAEILSMGGTDTGAVQSSRAGVVSGAISIPLRYVHSDCETASLYDIEGTIALLVSAVKTNIQ